MKLKSFEKVRTATCTEYVVFNGVNGDNPVDSFTVDYLAKTKEGTFDTATINAAILRRMKYENMGAKVRFVDVNRATGNLAVTVDI